MNILEEFYFGNIDPNTQSFGSSSSYGQAMQIIADHEEKLSALLEGKKNSYFWIFAMHGLKSTEQRQSASSSSGLSWDHNLQ